MLYIVSELMVAAALATEPLPASLRDAALPAAGFTLPAPSEQGLAALAALPLILPSDIEARAAEFGQSAPSERLGRSRGGSGIASDTRLGGQVAGNTAHQVATGANSIDAGSFSGTVGLPVVIQNSGANVLIQNATVINLQFK